MLLQIQSPLSYRLEKSFRRQQKYFTILSPYEQNSYSASIKWHDKPS